MIKIRRSSEEIREGPNALHVFLFFDRWITNVPDSAYAIISYDTSAAGNLNNGVDVTTEVIRVKAFDRNVLTSSISRYLKH